MRRRVTKDSTAKMEREQVMASGRKMGILSLRMVAALDKCGLEIGPDIRPPGVMSGRCVCWGGPHNGRHAHYG